MTIYVRVFHSDQPGAPQISNTGAAGTLHDVLYACGVTGYAGGILDSLTHAAGVATATRAAGLSLADGLADMPHAVKISGSSNGWDGDYLLTAPPWATQCQFAVDPGLPSPATGTLTLVRSPAGMARLANAGDKSVWQFKNTTICPGYGMLDDNAAGMAYVRMAETAASPVDWATMTGLCPTAAQVAGSGAFWPKSQGSGGTKKWICVIWDGGLYLFVRWHDTYTNYDAYYLGACLSFKAGDGWPGLVIGHFATPSYPMHQHGFYQANGQSQAGQWLQRGQSGVGQAIQFTKLCQAGSTGFGGTGPATSNNPTDNKRLVRGPVDIIEGIAANGNPWRGLMPLVYNPVPGIGLITFDILTNLDHLPGRKLMAIETGQSSTRYPIYLDITGGPELGV